MGLFDFMKKKGEPAKESLVKEPLIEEEPKKVSLSKEDRVSRVNLRKQEVGQVCAGVDALKGVKARVALVLDYSGSMRHYYQDGTVQEVIEKMLPLAMQFDDDGNMETWIFDDGFHRLKDINLDNFCDYVKNEINYSMGCTCYTPVMEDIRKRYMVEQPAKIADYVIFITDGDNSDHTATTKFMKEVSRDPIFWQFVGIGNMSFNYLEALDDMQGRYIDNADFFKVSHPNDITYEQLLNEFPGWLADSRVQEMLK